MRHFRIALRFLTRYPVAPHESFELEDFGRATGYFPLVGLLAGLDLLLLRGLFLLDGNGLHYPLWCLLLLLFWVWSCDSLHLDGLADTADALASRKTGTEFAEVLHDSRVGSFGALALAMALIAKFAWLSSLPMRACWFLPLPLIFSRLHSALACQSRPYAGPEGSLSSMFITQSSPGDLHKAMAWCVAGFFALALPALYFSLASLKDLGLALGVGLGGLALGWALIKLPASRLGGISGDMIGWSQVITEIAVAFGLSFALVS